MLPDFSWAIVEFETFKQYPVDRTRDLLVLESWHFFLCSSVTKRNSADFNTCLIWWHFSKKLSKKFSQMFTRKFWYSWKTSWLRTSSPLPHLSLWYFKSFANWRRRGPKPLDFSNLCCGIKLLFHGYCIMERTVLGHWPLVKVAQVLPTSIGTAVCPINSHKKKCIL